MDLSRLNQRRYEAAMRRLGRGRVAAAYAQVARRVPLAWLKDEPRLAAQAFVAASQFVDWPGLAAPPRSRLEAAATLLAAEYTHLPY